MKETEQLNKGYIMQNSVTTVARHFSPRQQAIRSLLHLKATGLQAAGLGPLKEGITFSCSSALARQLLASPASPVLAALGKKVQFEIAVGQNGRFWINSGKSNMTILAANAIQQTEYQAPAEAEALASKLINQATGDI